MRKKIVLVMEILLFIGAIAFAGYFVNHYQAGKIAEKQVEESVEKQENVNSKEENLISEANVLEIEATSFEKEVLQSQEPVLVDFYADWCVPCQYLSPIVEEVAKEHPEVKFVRINVDEAEELANQYGIMYIPTLIFIKDGEQVAGSTGLVEKEAVVQLINQ